MGIGFVSEALPSNAISFVGVMEQLRLPTLPELPAVATAPDRETADLSQGAKVRQTDQHNCRQLVNFIDSSRATLTAIAVETVKVLEPVLSWKPQERADALSSIVAGVLVAAEKLESFGNDVTLLLRANPFIDLPAAEPGKPLQDGSRFVFLVERGRSLMREAGGNADSTATELRSFALNVGADFNNRTELPLGQLATTQIATLRLRQSLRNLERFALAMDGPAGFRTAASETPAAVPLDLPNAATSG